MLKALTEADGPSWREKLPPIPTVPLSVRQKLAPKVGPPPTEHNGTRQTDKAGEETSPLVSSLRVVGSAAARFSISLSPSLIFCLICFFSLFVHSGPSDKDLKRGQALKDEGNMLVKKGDHKKAMEKYSESLKHNPTEVTTYTNR